MGGPRTRTFGAMLRDALEARAWRPHDLHVALEAHFASRDQPAPSRPLVSAWLHDHRAAAVDHLDAIASVLGWDDEARACALSLSASRKLERRRMRRTARRSTAPTPETT